MSANSEQTTALIDCAKAASEISTFAGSRMPADRGRVLRAHLLKCEACKALYRETVEVAAALGHNLRADREDHESEEAEVRRAAYRSMDKIKQEKPNTFALRMILIPAFFFFLMVFVTKIAWPDDKIRVSDFGGAVFLGEDSFLPNEAPALILRGSWLTTNVRAFLELDAGSTTVRMGEQTFLLVEDPAGHRFRLKGGEVTLLGSGEITTSRGIVLIEDGSARVVLDGMRFELYCEAGEAKFIDATGETVVGAGEQLLRGSR